MLEFRKIDERAYQFLKEYAVKNCNHLTEYSIGFVQMWKNFLNLEYAIQENLLLLRAYIEEKYWFYYPIHRQGGEEEIDKGLSAIEEYCTQKDIALQYVAIAQENFAKMAMRYGANMETMSFRNNKDYLYLAEDFKNFGGRKYSGQRNHINKFKKSYPNYQFAIWKAEDNIELELFLKEWAEEHGISGEVANAELEGVFTLLTKIEEFGYFCGLLKIENKIVGFSIGERCGDCIIVHAEKALRGYSGIYPTLAQLFAQTFVTEDIVYLNREDDAGEIGLRKSKLQYLPIALIDKYTILTKRAIDNVQKLPTVKGERIVLKAIGKKDIESFAKLAGDVELNAFWGYDYRLDAPKNVNSTWFYTSTMEDFKKRMELPLAIYYKRKLIGQVVLHKFDYQNQAEIGMRILPEWQGRGFAKESLLLLSHYAFFSLGIDRVKAKAYRENEVSIHTLQAIGMQKDGEDEQFIYFSKSAAM